MRVREKRKSGVYLRRNSVSVNTTKRNIIPLPILQWYISSSYYSNFITRYQHDSLSFYFRNFSTQHYVVISLSPLCHMSTLTLLLQRHANFLFCVLTISMLLNPCLFNLLLCNVICNFYVV